MWPSFRSWLVSVVFVRRASRPAAHVPVAPAGRVTGAAYWPGVAVGVAAVLTFTLTMLPSVPDPEKSGLVGPDTLMAADPSVARLVTGEPSLLVMVNVTVALPAVPGVPEVGGVVTLTESILRVSGLKSADAKGEVWACVISTSE